MLQCPKCQSEIPADDVHLGNLVAKCRYCNEVFSFADQLPRPLAAAPAPVRGAAPVPPGVKVTDEGDQGSITSSWFTPAVIGMLLFCVAWDSFLVFWYTIGIAQGGPWIMFVFPTLHVGAGVFLTYATFATLVNRTVVTVSNGRLRVWHGPVPWCGNRSIPAEEIRAIFCDLSAGQTQSGWRTQNSAVGSYSVSAVLTDNRRIWLLTGLDNLATAKFYEDRLEGWLGLPPEPVPGEAN